MPSGTLTFSGTLTGFPSGARAISVSMILDNAVDDAIGVILPAGDTPFQLPSGATGVIIDPPSGNTIVVTLKGQPGDSGLPLHRTNATIWFFDTSAVSFVLSAAAQMSAPIQLTYF
jgi:hypothetical protein